MKLQASTKINIVAFVFGRRILELAKNMGFLYKNADDEEKHEMGYGYGTTLELLIPKKT